MRKAGEACEIEDRLCTECGECEKCELDPRKTCDNCCKCLNEPDADFLAIEIEDILLGTESVDESPRPVKKYRRNR